jgi:hypothetical protein
LLAAALAAFFIPVALSQGTNNGKTRGGWAPDEMYHVVKVTGSSNDMIHFDILGTAVKGKDGRVAVMSMDSPRSGTYYFANDTAVIPFGNKTDKKRHRPVMGNYSNATINVTGASAVVAMKNLNMSGKDKGRFEIQFTDIGMYLPNGTAKTYKLSAPAKVMKSADNSSMVIVGNPSVRDALQGELMSGATFPANAKPVMLKDIDAVK